MKSATADGRLDVKRYKLVGQELKEALENELKEDPTTHWDVIYDDGVRVTQTSLQRSDV